MGTTGNVKEEIISKDELQLKVVKYMLEKVKIVNYICIPFLNSVGIVYEEEKLIRLNEKGMISYLVNIIKGNRLSERKTIEIMNNIVDTIILTNSIGIERINLSLSNISFSENDDMIITEWYNCRNSDKNEDCINTIGKIFYSMMKYNKGKEKEDSEVKFSSKEVEDEEEEEEKDIKLKMKFNKYDKLLRDMLFQKTNKLLIEEVRLELENWFVDSKQLWFKNRIMKSLIKYNCEEIYYSDYHPIKREIIEVINNEIKTYNNNKSNDRMTINLNMGCLGSYGVEYLFEHINYLRYVKYLYMKHNDIDSFGMKCLSSHFIDTPLLSCLYLNENLIDDKAMKYFCKKCHYLTGLCDLNLSCIIFEVFIQLLDNRIKDDGVELLVEKISKLTKLKILQLSNNRITKQSSLKSRIYKNNLNKNLLIKI